MSFRELARVARDAGGKAGLDAFLLTYLQRKVKRAAGSRKFKQLPVISHGYVKGGCAYCNTIEGATIDRGHTFRTCPRRAEGLVVADSFPVFDHNFFLPPVEDGTARREVTASFFRSVFQVSKSKIAALQKKTVTKDVNRLLHNTGHHGAPSQLAHQLSSRHTGTPEFLYSSNERAAESDDDGKAKNELKSKDAGNSV